MHLFGFSKKAKKKPTDHRHRHAGLRKCKSTGNLTSENAEKDDSSYDSSTGDENSDTEDAHHVRFKSLDTGMDQKRQEMESQKQQQQQHLGFTEAAPQQSTEETKLPPPPPQLKVDDPTTPTDNNGADAAVSTSNKTINQTDTEIRPSVSLLQPPSNPHQPQTMTPGHQRGVDPNDLDALLTMETQQRVDAQTERDKAAASAAAPRPTRLKFELPVTPSRSRSPNNPAITYPRARPYRSLSEEGSLSVDRRQSEGGKPGRRKRRHHRWPKLMGSDTDEDSPSEQAELARAKRHLEIGTYVSLIKRPLPTMGYVRYIGPVSDEPGDWIGVELEHRVGNCDGSIKGHRYFTTDPQRGIFLKRFDVEAVV